MSGRIWAFSNGTEHMDWEYRNCDRCRKTYNDDSGRSLCDLNDAIAEAAFTDGYVSADIANRLGWTVDDIGHGACPELEPA
jgi:hypothetical protein